MVVMFVVAAIGAVVAGSVCGVVAVARTGRLRATVQALEARLGELPLARPVAEPPAMARYAGPACTEGVARGRVTAPRVPPAAPPSRRGPPCPGGQADRQGPSDQAPTAHAPVTADPIPRPRPIDPPTLERSARAVPAAAPLERPDARTLEQIVGLRWITWVGAVALLIGAGFFVQLAVDHGWLGPARRIALAVAFGVALAIGGDRALRRGMRALGQGVFGAGLGVLYVAIFVGLVEYQLYPAHAAFAVLVALTATGMTLAVRHDAPAIALLAVLGGLATPPMVSTGDGSREALCLYLTILDLGVLGVAFFQRWRALELVAVAGTWLLVGAWIARHGDAAAAPTLAWIAVLFAIFVVSPFAFYLRRRIPMTGERFVAALGNAGAAFALAHAAVDGRGDLLGHVALGMAAAYLALGAICRRRLPGDGRAIFGFVALAVGFATLAVPLYLQRYGITLAWAIEAPVLVYLGYRYRYFPVRLAGLAILGLATLRVFTAHWPVHAGPFSPFASVELASAMLVPLAGVVVAAICLRWRAVGDHRDRPILLVAAVQAAATALVLVHVELAGALEQAGRTPDARVAVVALWTAAALAMFGAGLRRGGAAVRAAGYAAAGVATVLVAFAFAEGRHGGALIVNLRFVVAVAAVVTPLVFPAALRRATPPAAAGERDGVRLGAVGGGVALWLLVSAEAYLHFAHPWLRQLALSCAWSGCAIALVGLGLGWRRRGLRLAGLALFGATAVKLLLVDLAQLEQIYRVVSFLVLGVVLIGASYLYHRAERTLRTAATP
jgi:uncharacterized membrane protein